MRNESAARCTYKSVVAGVGKPVAATGIAIDAVESYVVAALGRVRCPTLRGSKACTSSAFLGKADCSAHQSPDEHHGPADHRSFPAIPLGSFRINIANSEGRPSPSCTRTCLGGRNTRKARGEAFVISDIVGLPFSCLVSCCEVKRSIPNASGRCESSNLAIPARRSPTMPVIRASVISSFSASGVTGKNSPRCAEPDAPARLKSIVSRVLLADGLSSLSCSSLRKTLGSRMATGRRKSSFEDRLAYHIVRAA